MTENKIRKLLTEADFSGETDLRSRLREQLFGRKIVRMDSRQLIKDEDVLDMVNAAGLTMRRTLEDPINPSNDPYGGTFPK